MVRSKPRPRESSDEEEPCTPKEKKSSKKAKMSPSCPAPLAEVKQRREPRIKEKVPAKKSPGTSCKENKGALSSSSRPPKRTPRHAKKVQKSFPELNLGSQLDKLDTYLESGRAGLVIAEGERILQQAKTLEDTESIIRAGILVGQAYELTSDAKNAVVPYYQAVKYAHVYKNPEYRDLIKRVLAYQRMSTPSLKILKTLVNYHNLLYHNDLEDCGHLAKLKSVMKEEKALIISQLVKRVNNAWEQKSTVDILNFAGSLEDVRQCFGWFSGERLSSNIRDALLDTNENQELEMNMELDTSGSDLEMSSSSEVSDPVIKGWDPKALEEIERVIIDLVSTMQFESDLAKRIEILRIGLKGNKGGPFIPELMKNVLKATFYMSIGKLQKANEYLESEEYDTEKLDEQKTFFKLLKRGARARKCILDTFKIGPVSTAKSFEDFVLFEMDRRQNLGEPYNAVDYVDIIAPRIHLMLARGDWNHAKDIATRETQIDGFKYWTHPLCHAVKSGMYNRMVDNLFKRTHPSFYHAIALRVNREDSKVLDGLEAFKTLEELYWLLSSFLALQMSSRIPHMTIVISKLKRLFPLRGKTAALDALTFALNTKKCKGYDVQNENFGQFENFVTQEAINLFLDVKSDYECGRSKYAILDQPLALANYVIKRDNSRIDALHLLETALKNITNFTPFSVFLCINEAIGVWIDCLDEAY